MSKRRAEVRLTGPEIEHLLSVLRFARDEGTYYGPEQQFRDRAERLERILSDAAFSVGRIPVHYHIGG